MILSDRILGSTTTQQLRERSTASILQIGRDAFPRGALAKVDCFNYHAAATLSRVIGGLTVKDTRDLFERVQPSQLAVPGIGAIALAVLGAAFEAKGIGGTSPLEAWVAKHASGDVDKALVTFDTMKRREAAEILKEQKEAQSRRRARRARAHEIRVDRHTTRHTGTRASAATTGA